ncbi:hypothetical protein FOMG_18763 [Fusarium oxysporum f. sp. melonis 26406]|uniref:Fungal N-terminal domain-containing protein n=2 Tax=Fusarium oxysporum TaxID=5507 RepID=A0A559LL61_FUSOC|nr:hypothetical protein FOMG_18763 [Fusarium oxysporum f. sp. melonis 26406]TVY74373.1 hypothetical protein Focb16_v006182 [Fusarium oxysporum f. sp. cubense]TVY75014.1 hypothetical protein Focb16_v005863 [Fusarium oxysporum f. sp. cubense]
MAEALGVASSVIAVVDLSAKVFSLCLQYSREVKNAKDDIKRLYKEVAAFQDTTEKLKALLEGPRGKELKTSQQLVSAIEDGHSTLGQIERWVTRPWKRMRSNNTRWLEPGGKAMEKQARARWNRFAAYARIRHDTSRDTTFLP